MKELRVDFFLNSAFIRQEKSNIHSYLSIKVFVNENIVKVDIQIAVSILMNMYEAF